jgi:hypothetical protein
MWLTGNSIITRDSPLTGTVSSFPASDVGQNRVRIAARLSFGARQFCDNPSDGLLHLGTLLPVVAVVLNHEGRAYSNKYD